jgi:hypothetical protein
MMSQLKALNIYKSALIEDYGETLPQLPAEANPIDPQLADLRILDRHRIQLNRRLHQFRNQNRIGRNVNDEEREDILIEIARLRDLGIDVPENIILDMGLEAWNDQFERRIGIQNFGPRRQTNIDFSAPLLQLFWQTLLPWYQLGTNQVRR